MDAYELTDTADETGAMAAIRVGDKPVRDPSEMRWDLALVVFMRIVAFFWLVQGLLQWWRVLSPPTDMAFFKLTGAAVFAIAFFAILDLIAAVGLWLAANWGGVLWLLTACAQIFIAFVRPNFFVASLPLVACDAALIVAYFILTWKAAQEPGGERHHVALRESVLSAMRRMLARWRN